LTFARRLPLRYGTVLAASAVIASSAGCTGRAIQFVDLDFARIPEAGPLVDTINVSAAYWWLDGDRVCIAATRQPVRLLGSSRARRVDLSFVLPGVPAGDARDYPLGSEAQRCYVRQGSSHTRYRSHRGIAAIWMRPGGKLRVRYRVLASRQTFHILTGWTTVGQTLLAGELIARHDPVRGTEILERTEADGMNRAPSRNATTNDRPRPVQINGPPVRHRED
jgi:hypothetical protein